MKTDYFTAFTCLLIGGMLIGLSIVLIVIGIRMLLKIEGI